MSRTELLLASFGKYVQQCVIHKQEWLTFIEWLDSHQRITYTLVINKGNKTMTSLEAIQFILNDHNSSIDYEARIILQSVLDKGEQG